MTRAKIAVVVLALAALLLPVVMPWIKTPLIMATAFGIAALGISILIISGQISFGHALYVCAGGYIAAFAVREWAWRTDGGGAGRDYWFIRGALSRHFLRHAESCAVDGALCGAR
jgi:ABC-type branched-subunit amino acid transport system permease subunit